METARNYQPSSLHSNGSHSQQLQSLYTAELQEPDEDQLDIGQIWNIVCRRAVLIAGVATAVTAVVAAWTLNQTPQYQGTFQILVESVTSENKLTGISSLAQNLGAGAGLKNTGLDYESQLAVLQSPKVMEPIIQQMQVRYPKINYKLLFDQKTLTIERIKKTKIIQVSYKDADPEKIQFVLEQVAQGYLDYSFKDRQTNSRQGIQFIDKQLPEMRDRVDKLQEQLQLFRQERRLIDPQVQGQKLAEQVTSLENQRLQARTQLNQQLGLYENLQRQLGQDPDVAIAISALTQAGRYQELLNQLRSIETRIAYEKVRFTDKSPSIQLLYDQRNKLIPLIEREALQVLGENIAGIDPLAPPYQDSIHQGILQQLISTRNTIDVVAVQNQAVDAAINNVNQEVQQFPVIVREFTDLQRELGVATNTLNQLLAQREGLRVEAAKEEVPWELMEEDLKASKIPRDKNGKLIPAYPQLSKRLLIGGLLGLLLGLGAALLAERLNNVFHTPDDVKDATRWPLLGVIPFSDRAAQLPESTPIVDSGTNAEFEYYASASPFMEAFRSLNANLRLLSSSNSIRSLTISSAAPADGKSTVALNLAQAAAAMGQRVLLVDADLRWPQISAKLGIPSSPGLSDIIAKDLLPEDVIVRSRVEPNLFVLTAGSIAPDPIRLLSSKKMLNLITQWQADYDMIIYDTPPLVGLADSSLLASHTDGILLVVGIGQTDRAELRQALEGLQTSGTPVLGIVANKSKDYAIGEYYDHRRFSSNPDEYERDPDAVTL